MRRELASRPIANPREARNTSTLSWRRANWRDIMPVGDPAGEAAER
jgi:hypothetical protein